MIITHRFYSLTRKRQSWTCLYCFALCSWQVNHRARGGNHFIGSVLQHVNRITNGRLPSPKRDKGCSPRHPVSGTLPADKELEENIYGPCEVLMLSFKHVCKILTWELCKLYHFYQQNFSGPASYKMDFSCLIISSYAIRLKNNLLFSAKVSCYFWTSADVVKCIAFWLTTVPSSCDFSFLLLASLPPFNQAWSSSCSSILGLQVLLHWTRWSHSTTRGHSPCAFPGKVRWWVPWKLTGSSLLPLTIAKAGRWWTLSSTGTHLKVSLVLGRVWRHLWLEICLL